MPSRIAVDALEPRRVAEFWCSVLGWSVTEEDATGVSIAPADGTGPTIDVFAVPEGKAVKNRLHLDVRADGLSTEEELERLLRLGARRVDVGQGPHVSWTVLGDPEGNEFCLLSRTVQQAEQEQPQFEAWARSEQNPVGGWYGLRKGYRGRFAMYVPPLLEHLGLVELEHNPRNNRLRAL